MASQLIQVFRSMSIMWILIDPMSSKPMKMDISQKTSEIMQILETLYKLHRYPALI